MNWKKDLNKIKKEHKMAIDLTNGNSSTSNTSSTSVAPLMATEAKPFKLGEVKEDTCSTCKYETNCAILPHVNKLSVKRDKVRANATFCCNFFTDKEKVF